MERGGREMHANSRERGRTANRVFRVGPSGESPRPRGHCYGIGQEAVRTSSLTLATRGRFGGSSLRATMCVRTSKKLRAHSSSESFEILSSANSIRSCRTSAHSSRITSRLHLHTDRGG